MSRPDLLRLIADRGGDNWALPAAVDGLREGETPSLYFHDVALDVVGPWLDRLNADPKASTKPFMGFAGTQDFTVTTWHGEYLGTRVEIRLYRGTE